MSAHEKLAAAFLELHPERAARLLEALPPEQATAGLATADSAIAAQVLGCMLPTYAARRVELLAPAEAAALLEQLGSQEAVAVLRHLENGLREQIIGAMGAQWVVAFKLLLSYPPNTVGAWVEPRVLTLPDDCTAGDARERIARSPRIAQARIYVLDRSQHIRGAIRGVALLQTPNRKKVSALLEPADALWARDPLPTALEHAVWERNTEAPVVNREDEFIGAISYADLRKAFKQLARIDGHSDRDVAEVTELFAIGAGTLWQSLGELVRSDRRRR
jgi:magnesium transporter